jgi:hypothetical protein
MLEPGGLVIEGIALDTRATQGVGIDHVDFFLGNRDEGGVSVGSVVPGATTGPFGAVGSFATTIELPNITGGNDLFGYAHSSVTGQEVVISIPVVVGEDPVVAGETTESGAIPTMTETCTPQAGQAPNAPAVPATTPSTPSAPMTTTPSTAATTPAQSMVSLEVANPAPDDTVLAGAFVIQGVAMDHRATSGVGIDRIDIFLDNRDEGGTFLSSASLSGAGMNPGSWTATVDLPSNMKGLHSLWFYAHSTVTDGETTLEIPVTIE